MYRKMGDQANLMEDMKAWMLRTHQISSRLQKQMMKQDRMPSPRPGQGRPVIGNREFMPPDAPTRVVYFVDVPENGSEQMEFEFLD